jgi:hypothetical protein
LLRFARNDGTYSIMPPDQPRTRHHAIRGVFGLMSNSVEYGAIGNVSTLRIDVTGALQAILAWR